MKPRTGAPVHIMRWAPQDWLASPLRAQLAMERDHLARAVYRDLLDQLHVGGGYLHHSDVAGACLVSDEEAQRALARLLASKRIEETAEGLIFNQRVLDQLAGEEEYREQQAERGRRSGEARRRSLRSTNGSNRNRTTAEPPSNDGSRSVEPPTPTPTPTPEGETASSVASRAPRKASAAKNRTSAPDALEADQIAELERWCREKLHRPDLAARVQELVEASLDHHRGRGSLQADWLATARTWIRREADGRFGARRPATTPKPVSGRAKRRELAAALYGKGLLRGPYEEDLHEWELAGKPQERHWWPDECPALGAAS